MEQKCRNKGTQQYKKSIIDVMFLQKNVKIKKLLKKC
jgi:hypothetical protein